MMTQTYLYEDIFQDIPDDPDNVLLTIPEEVCNNVGIMPGDRVRIRLEGQSLIIEKVDEPSKDRN
jgi:hypothetical protein